MAKRRPVLGSGLIVASDEPLIGVLVEEQGRESVYYFTDEAAADAALSPTATEDALSAIGAFADLDWNEMEDALDRIRHEPKSRPR